MPLATFSVPGRFVPYAREMANMMALFDAVGFATDPCVLREVFGVPALTIGEWAREDH